MKKYKVWHGLGGGFGGAREYEVVEVENKEEAEDIAYNMAVEDYQSYEGLHGLKSWYEILSELNNNEYKDEILKEENEDDIDIVNIAYDENMSSWLDYWVEEIE